MHNFHLLLNNITITTYIHIRSTLLYTLGLCQLGPGRILLFCCELVAAAKLGCRKSNRNEQFRHAMSHAAPRPIQWHPKSESTQSECVETCLKLYEYRGQLRMQNKAETQQSRQCDSLIWPDCHAAPMNHG